MPRPLLKTFTYSLVHLIVAVSVAFALTGNLAVALSIGLIEPMVQTVAYAIHERAWEKRTRAAATPRTCARALSRAGTGPARRSCDAESGIPSPA